MKGWHALTMVFAVGFAQTALGTATEETRFVDYAIDWLMRHQDADGSWAMNYRPLCKDETCTSAGTLQNKTAATALGLLPFLGAGATPDAKTRFQRAANAALLAIINEQANDGNLSAIGDRPMTSHALAAICLSEAYNMTNEQRFKVHLAAASQAAVDFIAKRQNQDGGWSERPGGASDLSVLSWQMLALKSAQLAKLKLDPAVIERVKTHLRARAQGTHQGLFASRPGGEISPTATAIGVLGQYYFGSPSDGEALAEGRAYLMQSLPTKARPDLEYWFFATQAIHISPARTNVDWDKWNRAVRRAVLEFATLDGCASGSWDPQKLAHEPWNGDSGRLAATSLAALTLEVYYRYLPLFQLN